ncbi:MAG: AzlD domain-containing protein [Anaerolineales bacterium]|nr:AzlD domain-containing protein [Anaerolineales bacterium]
MNELYLIAGMAVVTFVIRYSMFAVAGRFEFSTRLTEALRYVPPTVLTAIIVPSVLMPGGESIDLSWTNAYLVGAVAAMGLGWVSNNLLLTIVGGMAVFLSWQWLVG